MDIVLFKEAVIARCVELGITDYEIYYQAAESTSVGAFQREINQFASSNEGGVCFRCIVDGKMGYASTEELSREEAARIVDAAVDNASALETDDPVFLGEGGQQYAPLDMEVYDLPGTEELIEAVLDTQKAVYEADSAVVDGTATQGICERSQIMICNSKGLELSYVNQVAGLITVAVVSRDGEMANGLKLRLAELSAIDRKALAEEAAAKALEKLGGQVPQTGVYDVVLSPKAMADLLQTYASIFSSEVAQKGLSKLADAEGTVIASEVVTIVDDPFHPDNPMPIHFDAEGSPTGRKLVVEQGRLETLLYNLKTANKAGKHTTGNASKANYKAAVTVRPFTLYLAPGELSREQLLHRVGNGIYVDSLDGLHAGADAVSGDFSLQSSGYLIRDGVLAERIRGFTVAGNFYDLLKKIVAVADDVQLPMALGMTAFGSPTVLVEGLSVAGK